MTKSDNVSVDSPEDPVKWQNKANGQEVSSNDKNYYESVNNNFTSTTTVNDNLEIQSNVSMLMKISKNR